MRRRRKYDEGGQEEKGREHRKGEEMHLQTSFLTSCSSMFHTIHGTITCRKTMCLYVAMNWKFQVDIEV